jgi:glycosyltransferase involved in cell wall biosynthesis
MKKLFYVGNVRLPTEKAHGIQIIKNCEALARMGVEVELVIPKRKNSITQDVFEYYDVAKTFKVTYLPCWDLVRWGRFGYWIELLTFFERAVWYLLFQKGNFYTREEFLAFCLKLLGKSVVWEAHMGQKNIFVRCLAWFRVPVVVISHGLKELYLDLGMNVEDILVAPDGVDLQLFEMRISRQEARRKLGLSEEGRLVVYTGSLYAWKGVETLNQAALMLPDVQVLVVTGKSYAEIPLYLKAANVLVIPNSAQSDISKKYTSPMKLFEYMASGTPIVASDLPSLREVLDESLAYFFTPDNAADLAKVINKAITEARDADGKAKQALHEVTKYTWERRSEKILSFIKSI